MIHLMKPFTADELSRTVEEFSERFMKPAAVELAKKIRRNRRRRLRYAERRKKAR